jgi:hypothetical protein
MLLKLVPSQAVPEVPGLPIGKLAHRHLGHSTLTGWVLKKWCSRHR